MAYVELSDGTPIYYRREGAGPTLVLLHGLMLNVDDFWTKNLKPLAESCEVIAIDHRSHGMSGKPRGEHSISQCARDLKEVLDALEVEQVTLAGVAFGAMVALEYRRLFGNRRLSKLVIIEAQVRLTNDEGWAHPTFGDFPAEAGAGFIEGCKLSREPLTGFLAGAYGSPIPEQDMARMQAAAWLTPTDAAISYVQDMISADYRADLAGVDLPTLLIYGRKSNVPIPSELGAWIADQIPNNRLELFMESGHSPFWEEPDKFNETLLSFVGSREA